MIRKIEIQDIESVYNIINSASYKYKGVIPDDRWKEPYMARDELLREIDNGIIFWCYESENIILGVMGIQEMTDVTLIRHAYVVPEKQKIGIGSKLLNHMTNLTDKPILIGTWTDANWAIQFYERHGFKLVTEKEKRFLLEKYWSIPGRQIETSVVLADNVFFSQH